MGYHLTHSYNHTAASKHHLLPITLLGHDLALHTILRDSNLKVKIRPLLHDWISSDPYSLANVDRKWIQNHNIKAREEGNGTELLAETTPLSRIGDHLWPLADMLKFTPELELEVPDVELSLQDVEKV